MLREITLGQYYASESVIHRLDPRVKLFGTMIYIISLFTAKGLIAYLVSLSVLLIAVKISKVPLKFMLQGLKAIVMVLILSVVCNMLFMSGSTVIWSCGIIHISVEGIETAVLMGIRLVLLVLGTSVMTLTTTPTDLTDGMEKGLSFLSKIKIPVHEIALMMSIALRFIPILVEETNKIMKAQISRGADFESGNIIQKVKNYVPIIVPLFAASFRRANDLSMAMEARCYRTGVNRTRLNPMSYKTRDYISYIIILAYVLLVIIAKMLLCYYHINGFWTI